MEAIDVDGGEYAAAFLHDGTVVEMGTGGETVVLSPSATRDLPRLNDLLTAYEQRVGTEASGRSPIDFANAWLRAEWEQRWPKRPAWLSRRLHGDKPPQVEHDKR